MRDRGGGGLDDYPYRYYPAAETQCLRMLRAVYSRRQVFERMVEFWHDHFNVQGWEFSIAPLFVHYDRDVIRPRTLGNFRAMLEDVAKAPAMLYFLDNKSSSVAGFNENFARELCELHTLGAQHYFPGNNPFDVPRDNGIPRGYCDNDVYEAARALTGWTMRDDHWQFPQTPEYDTGEFLYWDGWHDKASKLFLGRVHPGQQSAGRDGGRSPRDGCAVPAHRHRTPPLRQAGTALRRRHGTGGARGIGRAALAGAVAGARPDRAGAAPHPHRAGSALDLGRQDQAPVGDLRARAARHRHAVRAGTVRDLGSVWPDEHLSGPDRPWLLPLAHARRLSRHRREMAGGEFAGAELAPALGACPSCARQVRATGPS